MVKTNFYVNKLTYVMSSHGATDTETGEYVLPTNACKGRSYKCADCEQRVILRQGSVRIHHFAHFTPTTKCNYYNTNPGESDNHKHAKLLLQKWIQQKRPLAFSWDCKNQTKFGSCNTSDGYTEESIEYKDGDEVVLEYRDPNGKYIADVCILNNGNVRYIIEVKHSHQTTTSCRPEPWFEVDANDIEEGFHYGEECVYLTNCRTNEKRYCANCRVKQEKWIVHIPILNKKHGEERLWKQDADCLVCKRDQYSPEWVNGRPRQVCKICFGTESEKLHKIVDDLIWS